MSKTAGKRKENQTKKRTNWVLWIAFVALVIYIVTMIVQQNIKIHNAREQLEQLNEQISIQNIKIEELKEVAAAVEDNNLKQFEDYIEKRARSEFGLGKSDETVYINIAGE